MNRKIKQGKIFDKTYLEKYLSDNRIFHFNHFRKSNLQLEKSEYKDLINSIFNFKKYNIDINSSSYSDSYNHITELLSKICKDDKEYELYKQKIDAKLNSYLNRH